MDKKDGYKKTSPNSDSMNKKLKKKRKKSLKKTNKETTTTTTTKEKSNKISSKVKNRKGNTSASPTEGEHSVSDNNGGFESDASSIQKLQGNSSEKKSCKNKEQQSFVLNPLKGQSTSATNLMLATTFKTTPPNHSLALSDVRLCFSNSAKSSSSSRTTLCNIAETINELSLSQKSDSKSENESLRWDSKLSDSEEEEERISNYKINRRKRYIEAQNKQARKKHTIKEVKTTSFSSCRTLQPIQHETLITNLAPTMQQTKYKADNLMVGM